MFSGALIFPAEIQHRLLKNGELHQDLAATNAPFRLVFFPVVKLFVPGTDLAWFLTQIDPADRDRAFGLHIDGGRRRLGHVSLSEIAWMRGPSGAPVTWDHDFMAAKTLTAYAADDYGAPTQGGDSLSHGCPFPFDHARDSRSA